MEVAAGAFFRRAKTAKMAFSAPFLRYGESVLLHANDGVIVDGKSRSEHLVIDGLHTHHSCIAVETRRIVLLSIVGRRNHYDSNLQLITWGKRLSKFPIESTRAEINGRSPDRMKRPRS